MNLQERFKKYIPSSEMQSYMGLEVLKTKADVDRRMIEITVSSNYIVSKNVLYKLETEIKSAYELNFMKIIPSYPSELFSKEYIDDLIKEAYRDGAISKGFFQDYSVDFSLEKIVFKVPFILGGIDLLNAGQTGQVMSKIIKREFNLDIPVFIEQREDYKKNFEMFEAEKLNIWHVFQALKIENETSEYRKRLQEIYRNKTN